MRRCLLVLLFLLLLMSFVSAGTFTGSAGIEFNANLNSKEWGFDNRTKGKYSFTFEFDSTSIYVGSDHQTEVWAEIAAEAMVRVRLRNANLTNNEKTVTPEYRARITEANIHVGDITFGILNAGTGCDYAESYYDDDLDKEPDWNVVSGGSKLVPGFSVKYKDWSGGVGARGVWADNSATSVWTHIETPVFRFGKNGSFGIDVGGYAAMVENDRYLGGGFKTSYSSDKLSADLGVDAVVKKDSVDFGYEIAANLIYGIITLNVYAGSGVYYDYADDEPLKLDAMLSAIHTFDFGKENSLEVSANVEVRDVLVDSFVIVAGATETTTMGAFKLELSENASYCIKANELYETGVSLSIDAKATYEQDRFKAYSEIIPGFLFDNDDSNDSFRSLEFSCGISSDTVVEGADLVLEYKGADFLDFGNSMGSVMASCQIRF